MKKVNESDIIHTLMNWKLEAESGYNDGWTRYHYISKILKVKEYVNDSLSGYDEESEKERFGSSWETLSGDGS